MLDPFIQGIGMWYSKRQNGERVFDIICEWYKGDDNVTIMRKTRNDMVIYFKNGSWIKFFPANDNMRGQRCTDSFLIDDIDTQIIESVIRPITTRCNGDVWVLDTHDEDSIYRSIAYYRKKWVKPVKSKPKFFVTPGSAPDSKMMSGTYYYVEDGTTWYSCHDSREEAQKEADRFQKEWEENNDGKEDD